jgi:hypothetical protein
MDDSSVDAIAEEVVELDGTIQGRDVLTKAGQIFNSLLKSGCYLNQVGKY